MAKTQRKAPKKQDLKSRIPTFNSIEEEAEFWDTHDSTEFEDEWEEVTDEIHFIVVRSREKKALTVRLDVENYDALKAHARELGVSASKLAWLWLAERLHQEERRVSAKKR